MLCPDLPYVALQLAAESQIENVQRGNAWGTERWRQRSTKMLERMAEDNERMEGSAEGEGCFGKKNLIPNEAFSPESKYYLRVSNPIPSILGIELLILHGSRNTVHSG
ncbi:hypothetical protein D8674_039732 [Pyrus ussuriensis x Pyrus communis]|uniref:Uncharacterized protein n=1 Tax=Pyrus ussuriensis x Pyrus communis TaxID=2448454 RepID=A0A5N5H3C5_9ROSA|nr:hypothetical protein D8674_039732 [Pyrus ussuriensis x Pyrus communis]